MYMFSHECVGCVILTASDELSHYGKVMLEGKEHTNRKIIRTIDFPHPLLVVYLRGYLRRYDSEAALHIEGFTGTDGQEMSPQDLTIHIKPRRNRYEEKYRKHEAVALQTALESAVLLKNDGILPLASGMCVAALDIGNMVRAGISLLTPGSGDDWRVKPVRDELTAGRLSRATLVRNVARIVKTLAKRKSSVG